MKKVLAAAMIVFICFFSAGPAFSGQRPAPNSGNGVSDGSGMSPSPSGNGSAKGPAPNSGNGTPDGSGF